MGLILRWLVLCLLGFLLALGGAAAFSPGFAQSESGSLPADAVGQTPGSQTISAQTLMEPGRTYYQQGQWEAAIATWQTALATPPAQADDWQRATLWSYLAMAYQKVGEWEAGEGAIANTLQILDNLPDGRERTHLLAQTLNTQGQLAFAQGHPEVALGLWQQTTDLYQDLGHGAGITGSLINQSRALETLGHHRRACQTLLTAIDLGDQSCDVRHGLTVDAIVEAFQQQPDGTLQILGLRSLGSVLRLTGQLSEAQQLLIHSVALAEEQAHPQQKLLSLLSLGKAEQTLYEQAAYRYGQTGSAEDASTLQAFANQALARYAEAEVLAQARPTENTALLSQSLVQHLALLVNLHDEQWSDTLFPTLTAQLQTQLSTVKKLPTLPPSHANFYTQISLAQSYIVLLRSQPEVTTPPPIEIIALLTQVEQQAADLSDTQSQSYALGTLGRLYEQLAQQHPDLYPDLLPQAQQVTKAALQLADQDNHITYQWQWQLGRIYAAQQDEAQAIATYQQAVDTLNTLRQDLMAIESEAQFSFRDRVEPLYRELVALMLGQPADAAPSSDNLLQAIREIDALQLTQLENFLSCNLTETFALSEPQPDTTTAIIYPIILPDQVAVIMRLPQSRELQFHRVPIPEAEVTQILTQLRQQTENRYLSDTFWALSEQVYTWLIRPFETALAQQQIQTLVFVSDGALRNVPMAVLSSNQRFLIEDYAIALSPGLQLPQSQPLSQVKLGAMVSDQPSAIAYGLSEIRSDFSPHQGFAPLTNVETELANIETQVGSRQFINQAFTRKALQELGGNYTAPIVHLATHGQFSSDPSQTFLLAWDQRITLNDFSNILENQGNQTADPIELLILSACKTANGDNRATLGLAGIAIQSGARSTIASLWSVDDQATAEIMQRLYQHLGQLTPNTSRADILRQAQIELLKTPGYQAPFYWAPYVLVGNWS